MNITPTELATLLLSQKGAKAITFTATTDARAKKRGNPYGTILKTNTINGMVNFHYDAGVLRRLEKEGKSPESFVRGSTWHEPIIIGGCVTPLCRHKTESDNLYVRFMFLNRVGEPTYSTAEGVEVSYSDIADFLPAPSEYANQGLDRPLVFLTYSLDNVQSITMGGETYTISVEQVSEAA